MRRRLRAKSCHALVAQWIEHLTTDQKVRGSSPFERAERNRLTAGAVTEEGSANGRGLLSFSDPCHGDVQNGGRHGVGGDRSADGATATRSLGGGRPPAHQRRGPVGRCGAVGSSGRSGTSALRSSSPNHVQLEPCLGRALVHLRRQLDHRDVAGSAETSAETSVDCAVGFVPHDAYRSGALHSRGTCRRHCSAGVLVSSCVVERCTARRAALVAHHSFAHSLVRRQRRLG